MIWNLYGGVHICFYCHPYHLPHCNVSSNKAASNKMEDPLCGETAIWGKREERAGWDNVWIQDHYLALVLTVVFRDWPWHSGTITAQLIGLHLNPNLTLLHKPPSQDPVTSKYLCLCVCWLTVLRQFLCLIWIFSQVVLWPQLILNVCFICHSREFTQPMHTHTHMIAVSSSINKCVILHF